MTANPTFDVSSAAPGIYSLEVEVTDANGCSDSDGPVLVTVRELPTVSASATSPICPGENIELSGGATGGTPPYVYSWSGPDGFSSSMQNPTISGASPSDEGTYTLTVRDIHGCASTDDADVVLDSPASIATPPSNVSICQGLDASFSVTAEGTAPFTYQWERNTGGGFVDIAGATSASLTVSAVTPGMDGYQYRCEVTGHCSSSVMSASATLTVLSAPVISSGPSNTSVPEGDPASFSVTATGEGSLSYQWQQSTDGGSSWSNVGTDSDTYTIGSTTLSMDGYEYRCIVSGDCSPDDTSSSAELIIADGLYDFTSHTFTTCGVTDRYGPTLSQCRSSYSTSWDENPSYFNMSTQGIQRWTVPQTGTYRITAAGGEGGPDPAGLGGDGAVVQAEFDLVAGDILQIVVASRGESHNGSSTGGGGGSFVVTDDDTPLIIAGGGAGGINGIVPGDAGAFTENSTQGRNYGINLGGRVYNRDVLSDSEGGGAGGFSGNGEGRDDCYGRSFTNGAIGGWGWDYVSGGGGGFGGFGGGGSYHNSGSNVGGGGGGYTGGSGNWGYDTHAPGGGGSYVAPSGSSRVNVGHNTGNGYVTIELL